MPLSQNHRYLVEQSEKLFKDRQTLESFWQESAIHFYPQYAEFTSSLTPGDNYADNLTTSYPILVRRTLADSFAAFLRPITLNSGSPGVWFSIKADDEIEDIEADRWLEMATKQTRSLMYQRSSQFVRATKEADHQFATFGQAPISVQLNRNGNGLLYQCWHLKDVAWTEDASGEINAVFRKWEPTAAMLKKEFGKRVDPHIDTMVKQERFKKVKCLHVVMKGEDFELTMPQAIKGQKPPWVSIWIDVDNSRVMEETGSMGRIYVIPRWVTIPGSQYASSPAVTAALPDARLIQSMALTIMEAGEKFADPPLLGTTEVIRSDVQTFPGGITWLDSEYDERLGPALQPLFQPTQGQSLGPAFQMQAEIRDLLSRAFYLDTLSLPPADVRQMTAFEVGQRTSEWIRRAMPVFEPLEYDYNAQIIEESFDLGLRAGFFGAFEDIPDALSGQEVQFKFESPLHESQDRQQSQELLEAIALIGQVSQIDPNSVHMLNAREALRDSLKSVGVESEWLRGNSEIDAIVKQIQENEAAQADLAGTLGGAEAAKNIADASKSFAQAEGSV